MPIIDRIDDTKIPVLLWTPLADKDGNPLVELNAIEQIRNTANLPCAWGHVAIMPDVHFGYGAPVGTVAAFKDGVPPEAVGVDIGCGMMAVRTHLDPDKVMAKRGEILHSIGRSIPTGFHENRELSEQTLGWKYNVQLRSSHRSPDDTALIEIDGWKMFECLSYWRGMPEEERKRLSEKAKHQLGTLGGGNHFLEVCLDTDRYVWVMLHSGSRHIGLRIAQHYTKKAMGIMKGRGIELPDPYLAYIPADDQDFHEYLDDLNWAQQYAMANREEMMRKALKDLSHAVNDGKVFVLDTEVNCHHNYANIESYGNQGSILVVRKGAISAKEGEFGIIPGSMGAKSYIVRGKGNVDSFQSCSHGAGRKMGRKAAKRQFTVEDLRTQMQGIECRIEADVVDEIPGAYKDIDTIISQQSDLVQPVTVLKQMLCLKGGKE